MFLYRKENMRDMQCERCKVEMEKGNFDIKELHFGNNYYSFGGMYGGHPVSAKSVYVCPKCGKMEFNIKE